MGRKVESFIEKSTFRDYLRIAFADGYTLAGIAFSAYSIFRLFLTGFNFEPNGIFLQIDRIYKIFPQAPTLNIIEIIFANVTLIQADAAALYAVVVGGVFRLLLRLAKAGAEVRSHWINVETANKKFRFFFILVCLAPFKWAIGAVDHKGVLGNLTRSGIIGFIVKNATLILIYMTLLFFTPIFIAIALTGYTPFMITGGNHVTLKGLRGAVFDARWIFFLQFLLCVLAALALFYVNNSSANWRG
jgi:hypothetical protein